jgi:trehalose/maltose hydrolase-like predicted phosphorylase
MIAAYGFAGLKVTDGAPSLTPCLPERIDAIGLPVTIRGKRYMARAGRDKATIE